LEERRVPLIVEWDAVTGSQLHEVLAAFQELPLLLVQTPRMGRNRTLYPLLEQHENLYVAVTPTYSVYRGIEDLCERFGASRLLFGSGYPEVEGGAAVCMLSYAEIPGRDRQAVACGNLERLLGEVRG
jgi:predicted TIM-barrel fold metal-dependent hydrolase